LKPLFRIGSSIIQRVNPVQAQSTWDTNGKNPQITAEAPTPPHRRETQPPTLNTTSQPRVDDFIPDKRELVEMLLINHSPHPLG